jgi:SPP1 gp7 family putative phage head morphogenesis protein
METENSTKLRTVNLAPIYHPHEIFEEAQERIEKRFLDGIYKPLLAVLSIPKETLQNSQASDLQALQFALQKGTLTFNRGQFSGKFNSTVGRAMRSIGAEYDRQTNTYRIHYDKLPSELQEAVDLSDRAFSKVLRVLDQKLRDISEKQKKETTVFKDLFDRAIFNADEDFKENVKKVTVEPKLNEKEKEHLSQEWEENMDLDIKEWEQDHIKQLRQEIKKAYFAGDRYGSLIKTVQSYYDMSDNHARFIARQETKLLVSNYVQSQYQNNGFPEYVWQCVRGGAEHPVRPYHERLRDTVQRWDDPPKVDKYGNRKHPGQDYGCRCTARPILRVS